MKKTVRFISFLLVLSVVMYGVNFYFSTNNDRDGVHIKGYFKEPENSLDVVLIGASELYAGFNSPLAWKEYGFTSYSISYASMPGNLYKTITKKALETQNPKLLVFEINGFIHGDKYYENHRPVHAWFDTVGIDADGRDFIERYIPENDRTEFYLPFYKYHSNWSHPIICSRNAVSRFYLAAEGISYTKAFANTNLQRTTEKQKERWLSLSPKSRYYMYELLNYCRDAGLKNVLFIRAPHCVKNKNPNMEKDLEKLIEGYGYKYADFENSYEEIGLNTKTDFYNFEHLNVYGMEKFTRFFAKYITDNYNVRSVHSMENIRLWNRCVEVTEKTIAECKADKNCYVYYELTAFETVKGRKHGKLSRIKCSKET